MFNFCTRKAIPSKPKIIDVSLKGNNNDLKFMTKTVNKFQTDFYTYSLDI